MAIVIQIKRAGGKTRCVGSTYEFECVAPYAQSERIRGYKRDICEAWLQRVALMSPRRLGLPPRTCVAFARRPRRAGVAAAAKSWTCQPRPTIARCGLPRVCVACAPRPRRERRSARSSGHQHQHRTGVTRRPAAHQHRQGIRVAWDRETPRMGSRRACPFLAVAR